MDPRSTAFASLSKNQLPMHVWAYSLSIYFVLLIYLLPLCHVVLIAIAL